MTTEVIFLEELLVVVRHTNHVKLHEAFGCMDSCWMDISMDQTLIMEIGKSFTELTENA